MAKVAAQGNGNIVKFPKKGGLKAASGAMDFTLLFCVLVLLVAGLAMMFSASSAANMTSGKVYEPILKQALLGGCGVLVMLFISKIDYKIIKNMSVLIYIAGLLMTFAVPFVGVESHGAVRQIDLKIMTIQPSEFTKYFLVLVLAAKFASRKTKYADTWEEIISYAIYTILPAAACFLQSHGSAALFHIALGGIMVLARGIDKKKWKVLGPLAVVAIVATVLILFSSEYRVERLMSFLGKTEDSQGADWQSDQANLAVGSGGLFGLGIGNSRQKYSYLPEAENDYIFAIVAEEIGFIGSLIVIALFVVVIWRGILISINCNDAFGSYLAFGISVLIGLQVFINMGVVLQLLPPTGMQLPLFSSGGTSLLLTLAGFGVLLSISRNVRASKI